MTPINNNKHKEANPGVSFGIYVISIVTLIRFKHIPGLGSVINILDSIEVLIVLMSVTIAPVCFFNSLRKYIKEIRLSK